MPTSIVPMITCEQLKGAYSEGEALAVYHEVCRQGDFAAFCREFMHNADYQVARNALWCLTKASHEEIRQCQPLLHQLIDLAMTTANSSVRRLSLNVVERLDMPEDDVRSDFLDFCFAHFADVAEYPGIQSLCLKLAHRMCRFYPELMGELKRTLEAMEISEYSPALRSVRSRILWLSRNLVGISINFSKSEEEELFINNASQRSSECLNLCIERFCSCV